MNDGGVCRTAPATPGLLKNLKSIGVFLKESQKRDLYDYWQMGPKISISEVLRSTTQLLNVAFVSPPHVFWTVSSVSPNMASFTSTYFSTLQLGFGQ